MTGSKLIPDSLEALQDIWSSRQKEKRARWSISQYVQAGMLGRDYGQLALANDVLVEAAARYPKRAKIEYVHALILAEGGAREAGAKVEALLDTLPKKALIRPDTLALKGRIAKDRYAHLPAGSVAAKRALRKSIAAYAQAYAISGDPFHGINEASTRRMAGESRRSCQIAQTLKTQCLAESNRLAQPDRWVHATIAEASLLLGHHRESARYYRKSLKLSRDRPGAVNVIRRQINRLSKVMEIPSVVKAALKIGPVVVFTGHMIDAPGKPVRFPEEAAEDARAAVGEALDELQPAVGFCSLACGGDLLFFEEMKRRRLERRVYLPFESGDFERESVSFANRDWVERYRSALRSTRGTIQYTVRDGYLGDDCLFAYNNQFTRGEALLQARSWGTKCILLALLDSRSTRKVGGAMDMVSQWGDLSGQVALVDLNKVREKSVKSAGKPNRRAVQSLQVTPSEKGDLPHGRRAIRTMLFADMVGFSKLKEPRLPSFFELYLRKVDRLLKRFSSRVPFFNTWGDGLYLVFERVEDAADFSLGLRDAIERTNWVTHNLPAHTSIRIGLHTGPVFRGRDPILQRTNFFGAHVTHAARIEPVTLPGTVYASEQTAALLAAEGNERFACDYLGKVEFAKKYGAFTLYRLRRHGEAN